MTRGVYPYKNPKDKKKMSEKEKRRKEEKKLKKKLEKNEKKVNKQSYCNHYASNDNKTHFKKMTDDAGHVYRKCKICGAKLIAGKDFIDKDAMKTVSQQVASAIFLIRKDKKLGKELNEKLATTIKVTNALPDIIEKVSSTADNSFDKDNKKKKKGKKGKGKGKNKKRRANY